MTLPTGHDPGQTPPWTPQPEETALSRRRSKRAPHRPTRITEPRVRTRLLQAFQNGCSVEASCYAAGIHPATFYNWANRAAAELDRLREHATPDNPNPEPRAEEWAFVELFEAVSRVRAERQERMLGIVDKVAVGGSLIREEEHHTPEGGYIVSRTYTTPDWRAAAWWVERSFPAQFGKQGQAHTLEVTGKGGGPIEVADSTAIAALTERLGESFARQREEQPALAAAPVDAKGRGEQTARS